MSREEDNTVNNARKLRAERIRASLNDFETGQVVNPDVANLNTEGLFAKCLDHNVNTLLPNEAEVIKLLLAMERGTAEDLENVTLHSGATRKLANPLAAFLTELEGGDAYGFTMPVPPAVDSEEAADEMIEVYEMALNRDTDFNTLNFGGADTDADRAVTNVTVPGVTTTRANLFRGVAPGCADGPYVSQLLIHDVPIGAHTVEQKYTERTGNYGTMKTEYNDIIEGEVPVAQTYGAAKYICDGRTLGSVCHNDLVYQQYLYAMAILHNYGAGKHSAFDNPTNSGAFVTNGGAAHISTAVGAVAAHALSATWVQKWRHHMRLRPEEMAARAAYNSSSVHTSLTSSTTFTAIGGDGLLPMIYAEGSPTHPSYPAGHAVIAGACTTILKMFYAEADWADFSGDSTHNDVLHSTNGTDRVEFDMTGHDALTIHGELNKLAANISLGRNWAGVHYRTDGDLGMELGEKIAIAWFKDNIARQIESVGTITFVGFDGATKTV
jgi:hypothetical protein